MRGVGKTILIVLVALLLGGGLIWIASTWTAEDSAWRPLGYNIGSFIVASGAMAAFFQFWQVRDLLNEFRQEVGMTEAFARSGIRRFSTRFHETPWAELFAEGSSVRLVAAYARPWRNANRQTIAAFLNRKGARLDVILPNPGSEPVVTELARRFNLTAFEMRKRITEAEQDFRTLGQDGRGHVHVCFYPKAFVYRCYLFESRGVFATYRHRPDKGPVVTMELVRSGEFYHWLADE